MAYRSVSTSKRALGVRAKRAVYHRDLWWEVDESTDIAKLGDQVVDTLQNYAVPWFQSLATRKELIHAFEHRMASLGGVFPAQVPLVLAIFAAARGCGRLRRVQPIDFPCRSN